MARLSRKLRIGEKIGFGFGLVGFIFLGVIWQYHRTLQEALVDYHRLDDVYEARKALALRIQSDMLRAQRSQRDFILTRDPTFSQRALADLDAARAATAEMGDIDASTGPMAERMTHLIDAYEERFGAVVEAWRSKGLDHDSGLQGAFRDSVHELEDMAGRFKVDRLYLLLLQIRRSEKDLGLRREDQYRERVFQLIQEFSRQVAASELANGLKTRLFHEIEVYRETFAQYAVNVLEGAEIGGGKGPFRQAAHRIEALLESHYLSGLGEKILQVRRREKDYLLRLDKQYVTMTLRHLDEITREVEISAIAAADKKHFTRLLEKYRKDFLALVDQNDRIAQLANEMQTAVAEIVRLVEENVSDADRAMTDMRMTIDESTVRNERIMLWLVATATALGVLLAFAITRGIVRPLRRMADLLDRLASEEPTERVPFFPGGRDEVNAMAGSVNAIADHKAGFIAWWKASMQEADACRRLEGLLSGPHSTAAREEAGSALRQAVELRKGLLQEQYRKLHQLHEWIIERAEELLRRNPTGRTEIALNTIRYSARSAQTLLEMAGTP